MVKAKLFTVQYRNQPYNIQMPYREQVKSSVLCFQKQEDAERFAKVVESHYMATKQWLSFDSETQTPVAYYKGDHTCTLMDVKMWDEWDLNEYCDTNLVSLAVCENFSDSEGLTGKIMVYNNTAKQDPKAFLENMFNRASPRGLGFEELP